MLRFNYYLFVLVLIYIIHRRIIKSCCVVLCRIAIYATGVIFFRGTHKVRDNFRSVFNYLFRGLGLRIRVRVWVTIRVRVSVVLWSG